MLARVRPCVLLNVCIRVYTQKGVYHTGTVNTHPTADAEEARSVRVL